MEVSYEGCSEFLISNLIISLPANFLKIEVFYCYRQGWKGPLYNYHIFPTNIVIFWLLDFSNEVMNIVFHFIFLIISFSCPLIYTQVKIAKGNLINPVVSHERAGTFSIGAIFDETSRPGKEAKVAIEMVVHDYNSISNQNLFLHFRNSQGKPVRAALAGKISFFNSISAQNTYIGVQSSFVGVFYIYGMLA